VPLPEWSYELFLNHVIPEDKEVVNENFQFAINSKSDWNFECRIKREDGEIRWIKVKGKQLNEEKSITSKMFGIVQDVTESKLAEVKLRESEAFKEKLLNTSPDIIYIYDLLGKRNVYSNDSILKVLGYSVDEVQKKGDKIIPTLMHPEDLEAYIQKTIPRYEKLKDNELLEHKYRMKHKDGRWCWLRSREMIYLRSENGVTTLIFGIISDITETVIAEAALRESEERYRLVQENSLDAILLMAADGRILSANAAASKMFQLTEEEICQLGRNGLVDKDDPSLSALLVQRATTGKAVGEINMLRKGETKFPVELSSSVFMDRNGEKLASMIIRDISERKNTEAELQLHKENLEKLVRERTTELEEKYAELERMNSLFVGRELRMIELKKKIEKTERKG
jgi:PAS domain S-box-containing protein